MSLTDWSIIYLVANVILYASIYWSVFKSTASFAARFVTTVIWFLAQFVTLAYGIATDQIGFILLFIIVMVFTLLAAARVQNDN